MRTMSLAENTSLHTYNVICTDVVVVTSSMTSYSCAILNLPSPNYWTKS